MRRNATLCLCTGMCVSERERGERASEERDTVIREVIEVGGSGEVLGCVPFAGRAGVFPISKHYTTVARAAYVYRTVVRVG